MSAHFKEVDFASGGHTLRGRLYPAASDKPAPCVVMAHGTSGTFVMVIDEYAEAFQAAGFNVLLYDHAGFGLSDGVADIINPWVQGREYRDACVFVRSMDGVHNGQVIIWGDSYAAGLVLVAGALIDNLAAVVAHIPSCGAEFIPFNDKPQQFETLKDIFLNGDLDTFEQDVTGPLPVVSFDQSGTPSLLQPIQAFHWFMSFGGRFDSNWNNAVSRVIPKTEVPFSPQLSAAFIACPTLMVAGRKDEMVHCNPLVQKAVFESIEAPKEWFDIDGGHFGCLYPGTDLFREAIAKEIEFMKQACAAGSA